MSPLFRRHPCSGCALQESRDGRVCPVAREVYDLGNVQTEREVETLRAAIREGAGIAPTLIDLVRLAAQEGRHEEAPRSPLALPPAPAQSAVNNSRKEAHVFVRSRPIR